MRELKILLAKLEEHEEANKDYVFTGVKDFGDYQKTCGVIIGLGLAKRELTDLLNVMERNNE